MPRVCLWIMSGILPGRRNEGYRWVTLSNVLGHALILHSAWTCIPLSHEGVPYSTNELQFCQVNDRPQSLWGPGNTQVRAPAGPLTVSAKPENTPVKLLDFPRHTLSANSQPGPFKRVVQAGFKDWCVFHHHSMTKKVKRGSSRLDGCSCSTLSALSSTPPLCLSSLFCLSNWLSLNLLSLLVSPLSSCSFVSFSACPFVFIPSFR